MQQDLTILSTCNEDITKEYTNDDPLERWRLYGAIHNPYIKVSTPIPCSGLIYRLITLQRRTTKYQPAAAVKPAAKTDPESTTAKPTPESKPAPSRKASGSEDAGPGQSTPQPALSSGALKSNIKAKPDIFGMFAKGKAKPKAPVKSHEPTPMPAEDGMSSKSPHEPVLT